MKKIFLSSLFLFTGIIIHNLHAQTIFTGWFASFNTLKIARQKSIHLDVQVRSTDEWQQLQTILVRPGINFHLTKKFTLSAGYAYISNKRVIGAVSDFIPEHRLWQQALYTHKIFSTTLSHRLRLEERFLPVTSVDNNEINVDHFTMAGRLRYFFRDIIPLKKHESFSKGVFVALQNEVFLNIIEKDRVNGSLFDQNRIYLALGYRLHAKADLEIGYMNQYVNGSLNQFTNNHVIQAAGYLRL